jgi:hypothetical protein
VVLERALVGRGARTQDDEGPEALAEDVVVVRSPDELARLEI